MAVPRVAPHGGGGGLPQPLAPSEAARVSRIFSLQAAGRVSEAARETSALIDPTLLGHILADRYLGATYHSTADDLGGWLQAYADHPDAGAIYELLKRRAPKGATLPAAPVSDALAPRRAPDVVPEEAEAADHSLLRNPALDHTVAERAKAGNMESALRLIASTKGMDPVYAAALKADLAQALFTQNRDDDALSIAGGAFRPSDPPERQVALAGYVAGLSAWRLNRMGDARHYFEGAARAGITTPALRAAAAFWAGRTQLRTGSTSSYGAWLTLAAAEKRTFYGLLARRILGMSLGLAWERETLGEADIATIAAAPAGLRAFALLQVNQPARAEAELRTLWPAARNDPALGRALLLVASQAGLTDLAGQLAELVQTADGRPRDVERFGVPRLQPRNGFSVDPPLVYALTRLESNFDPSAVSAAGARGLMQIMPVTAGYVTGDRSLAEGGRERLHDPAFNLDLGQRYVSYLAQQEASNNDLIRVLASYNSGPGSFARWGAAVNDMGDPLLFVESIPNWETRGFVQHVLTYTWIYAARMRLPAPSLDELALGEFPRFRSPQKPVNIREVAARLN